MKFYKTQDPQEIEAKQTYLRDWYADTYEGDELTPAINGDNTFFDLFVALDNGLDVYQIIGVGDSLIRERMFDKLASIMGITYADVYDRWTA